MLTLGGNLKILGYVWTFAWVTFSVRAFFLQTSLEDLYPVVDTEWVEKIVRYFVSIDDNETSLIKALAAKGATPFQHQ
jgi:hypothetical protein